MKIFDKPQHLEDGTENPEWLAARAGVFTASDFHQYLTGFWAKKLSNTASAALHAKAFEFVTGTAKPVGYKSPAMIRGTELEPEARAEYIATTFIQTTQSGFCKHDELNIGFSPDDFADDRNVEYKCPELPMFLKVSCRDYVAPEYMTQMQIGMMIREKALCDFVNYYPGLKLKIIPVEYSPEYQREICDCLDWLNPQFDAIVEQIRSMLK